MGKWLRRNGAMSGAGPQGPQAIRIGERAGRSGGRQQGSGRRRERDAVGTEDHDDRRSATVGPTGSWLSVTIAISTAVASSSDASTSTAPSMIQLRAIWAATATSINATTPFLPRMLRRTAKPLQKPSRQRAATLPSPATTGTATARKTSGSYHGSPSGPTSVNEASAASAPSTARMGTSAAISAGTRGRASGAARRSAPMRAAVPIWLLS